MNSLSPAERGAARRPITAKPRVPARRRPSLAEIVRDLAGWTLPARPGQTQAGQPLTNWPLV